MKSKVFFTDFRTEFHGEGILPKLHKLMKLAGFESIDFKDKFVAIKMHFGEAGNLAYLRPQYAKVVADYVKELGGKPFLTDSNTLYAGSRKDAIEHLATAAMNGFSEASCGCPILIGDGLKGTDEVDVPVPNFAHCATAKIGRAVMDADIVISLTHFKGHEGMGIGGAVKNLGMGCASRAGKKILHSAGKPQLDETRCTGCGTCMSQCAHGALKMGRGKMTLNRTLCAGCGSCVSVCPAKALTQDASQVLRLLDEKVTEYASAIVAGRPNFHISILRDIAPNCDCHGENDAAILPDIGMLAGFDPVALDMAACDLCNQAPRLAHTWLDDCPHTGDVFDDAHKETHWRYAVEHASRIGFGSTEYELVNMPGKEKK